MTDTVAWDQEEDPVVTWEKEEEATDPVATRTINNLTRQWVADPVWEEAHLVVATWEAKEEEATELALAVVDQ